MSPPADALFAAHRPLPERLPALGFMPDGAGGFLRETPLLGGAFRLALAITPSGKVKVRLVEAETGEEYILWRVAEAAGAFVGSVRAAVFEALTDLRAQAFEPDVFRSPGARTILRYARERYGDAPEFLWKRFPRNAVLRRADTKRWYAVLLEIPAEKLGLPGGGRLEILDVRVPTDRLPGLIDGVSVFPGYHMNKRHWVTLRLDEPLANDLLLRHLDDSHALARP